VDSLKTALVIPHGMAARNFMLGQFVPDLLAFGSLSVIHDLGPGQREIAASLPDSIEWIESPSFSEGGYGYILRRGLLLGHMRVCNTVGMRRMLEQYRCRTNGFFTPLGGAHRVSWWISKFARSHEQLRRWTGKYVELQKRGKTFEEYVRIFRKVRPDVVFCADQRPPEMAPLVAAARQCDIPVGTFIFSWDNLSSKGRIPCEFDFYCVWSKLMRDELLQFYPFMRPESIYITGTPQFEPYFDPSLVLSREEFCSDVGADPGRPIICYAGEDARTDPENPEHLRILCDLVRNRAIQGNPQILVRPTPSDDESRWVETRELCPEVIWCPPRWKRSLGGHWTKAIPTRDDVRLLVNMVRHCACCVNMVSTMTIDFAIGDRPTVNTAFDVKTPPPHGLPVWDVLFQFEHYRPVVDLEAAHVARSADDLAKMVNLAIQEPRANRPGREKLVRLQTDDTIRSASCNIAEVLTAIGKAL